MQTRKVALAAIVSLAALAACKKDDDDKKKKHAAAAPFLNPAAMLGGKHSEMDATRILEKMKDEEAFYLNELEDDEASGSGVLAEDTSEFDRCVQDVYNDTIVEGKGDTFTVLVAADLVDVCGQRDGIRRMIMKTFSSTRCPGADFSPFDGMRFGDLGKVDKSGFSGCLEGSELISNVSTDIAMDIAGGVYASKSEEFIGRADGTPCPRDVAGGNDGCVVIKREQVVGDWPGKSTNDGQPVHTDEDVVKALTSRDLRVASRKDPYYAGGSYDVVVNGWTGSVVYTGPYTAPTVTVSRGGENVTGAIGSSSDVPQPEDTTNSTAGTATNVGEGSPIDMEGLALNLNKKRGDDRGDVRALLRELAIKARLP
jgi:hypothetical protein